MELTHGKLEESIDSIVFTKIDTIRNAPKLFSPKSEKISNSQTPDLVHSVPYYIIIFWSVFK